MNKEEYIDNILLENDRLYKENQQLHNKIDKLEDELEWYKQECDDLEMSGDVDDNG